MNRGQFATVALAALIGLAGVAGAIGALGLSSADQSAGPGSGADGGTPAGEPDATPTDEPDDSAGQPADAPSEDEAVDGTHLLPESGELGLVATDGQVVRGETPLAAETDLTVRVVSEGENPFLRSGSTSVGDDGTFDAEFDLSGVAPGSSARVIVVHEEYGEVVNRSVTVGAPDDGTDGESTTNESEDADRAEIDTDGDALTLANASGQVVAGTAAVDAGDEVTIRLRSSEAAQPFLLQATATVGDGGTFRASFNLSDVEPGTTFDVVVRHDGETLTETSGEVVAE